MEVAVVGTGYVGLVAACCLAKSGHRVVAVEKNRDKLEKLKKGYLPILEEGLGDIFHLVVNNGNLAFTNDIKYAIDRSDIAIIAVGTPSNVDGSTDLSQVKEVSRVIAELAIQPLTVIMKSTVLPGIGMQICERFFSKSKNKISYASNPEFLREGKAVRDWYHPDRIIIGSQNTETTKKVMDLYYDIEAPKICMDITSAEMVKYASNAFLATKISFINEIANLCERVGADIDMVAPAVGMDRRIGPHFLQAGLGYGGSCFPKDTRGLDYISTFYGYNFSLLKSVIEVNSRQRIIAVSKLLQALKESVNKKVAVFGLAFKPGTDDIREAPALDIIDQLVSQDIQISVCDPLALDNARGRFPDDMVALYQDPYMACAGCAAIILTTEWDNFLSIDWERVKQSMEPPYVVLDGRNALNKEVMINNGFSYTGIGRLIK